MKKFEYEVEGERFKSIEEIVDKYYPSPSNWVYVTELENNIPVGCFGMCTDPNCNCNGSVQYW